MKISKTGYFDNLLLFFVISFTVSVFGPIASILYCGTHRKAGKMIAWNQLVFFSQEYGDV